MTSQQKEDILVNNLIDRIHALNEDILEIIGERLKQIGELTPTQIHQIQQMLLYDEDIRKIIELIADSTNMNVVDIYSMFDYVAMNNQEFAKPYYRARGVKYIPYSQNKVLKKQVNAIANITARQYINLANTTVLGYTIKDKNGRAVFSTISDTYKELIDKAILSVSQGKETYQQQMRKIIKEIGESGLKTVNYESGYSRRLDSAIRMNIQEGITTMTNDIQKQFGKEFMADGIEVSHHINSAPDHIDTVDGKQFSLNGDKVVNGKLYKNFDEVNNSLDRQVGTLNCRHYVFSIVLGISRPQYSNKQLRADKNRNKTGFYFDGEHYTMYEGTQLQRRIETEIRKAKDVQILAKASGDKDLTLTSQQRITQLTTKYRQLCRESGLPNQLKTRALVVAYHRKNVAKM